MKQFTMKLVIIASMMSVTTLSASFPNYSALFLSKKIYKVVNEDGTITFSDRPLPGAEEIVITVPTSNMESSVPNPSSPIATNKKDKTEYQIDIMSPEKDATIRSNTGEVNIVASITPSHPGLYQLSLNGQTVESPTGKFYIKELPRGAYTYNVNFLDNSGKIIASSETRNLYLHQASALIN